MYYNKFPSTFINLIPLTMNLDTMSFFSKISKAVTQVKSPNTEGTWMLLGYADTCRKSSVMSIDVVKEGIVWRDLLESFEDDKIQFGYAKLELNDNPKLFLIHWVGKDVEENLKISCMPHLNEIRNLIPTYDLLVNSMDQQDILSKVHRYLTRTQTICADSSIANTSKHSASLSSPERKEEPSKGVPSTRIETRRRTNTGCKKGRPSMRTEKKIPFTADIILTERKPTVKVAIIGSSYVGKSSIYMSYNGGGCSQNSLARQITLADLLTKDVSLGKHNFTLQIWDTVGQERFQCITSSYMRDAKVVICVYDITRKETFNELPNRIETAKLDTDPKAIFFLVGNKADLVNHRQVKRVKAEHFAIQHGMMFIECSGLTGLNILKLFENITEHVVFTYPDIFTNPDESSNDTIRVTDSLKDNKRGCQLCNK